MSTTKMITDAIKDASKAKTKGYDTTATVKRVEGSTVWVHIPGGVDETPVKRTINANIGDTVQVRVSDGSAWLVGNASAPPTDDTRANSAMVVATDANALAESASKAATEAWGYAEDARSAAATAETHADEAKASAENASEYAARAFGNLSTVQSITETLTWITQHGTMTNTQALTPPETALDPTHVYFVQDAGGDYVVGGVTYAVVTEPDVADIGTYYVLSIDESLNNYVGTHLALTSEGLWLIPEAGGNKVLIATGGAGHTYEDAGTYIIDENDNISAQFLEDGTTIYGPSNTLIAHLGYGPGTDSGGGTSDAPYYTLGTRIGTVGNYSTAEGYNTTASAYVSHAEGSSTVASHRGSHAEGIQTTASGYYSHAEGGQTTARGEGSHAEGNGTTASYKYSHAEGKDTTAGGDYAHAEGSGTSAYQWCHAEGRETSAHGNASHAQNSFTIAKRRSQTAIGEYNIADTSGVDGSARGDYVLIIGNGTADNARSNALTVDWGGNVEAAGGVAIRKSATAQKDLTYVNEYVRLSANQTASESAGQLTLSTSNKSCLVANKYDEVWSDYMNECVSVENGVVTILKSGRYRFDYQVYFYNGFTVNDIPACGIGLNGLNGALLRASRFKTTVTNPYTTLSGSYTGWGEEGNTFHLMAQNSIGARGVVGLSQYTRLTVTCLMTH